MFEKEAEEYGNEYWDCLVDSDDREMLQEAYKDGAEFGYNKANEWHEVEKGDLPKSSKLSVIGILKDGKPLISHTLVECHYSKGSGWSDCYGNSLYHEVEYWTESNFPKGE